MTQTPQMSRGWMAVLMVAALALSAGCATRTAQESTRTTVVLMPDPDGGVGAVSVTTPTGTQPLNRAYTATRVEAPGAKPSTAQAMGREEVERRYGDLLKMEPAATRTFVLYFKLDRAELTDESRAALPALFRDMREMKPMGIVVLGHADASGPSAHNLRLSAERAEAAARLLRDNDPSVTDIDVQFFGDTQPSSRSTGADAQARNRRVEIVAF